MKALSIIQPWSALIVAGLKDVENRSWSTTYRGELLIHAGKKRDEDMEDAARYACDITDTNFDAAADFMTDAHYGAIVGMANLVDVEGHSQSRWAEHGAHHWVLRNARAFAEPIPWKGALGVFGVFSADVEAAVARCQERTNG